MSLAADRSPENVRSRDDNRPAGVRGRAPPVAGPASPVHSWPNAFAATTSRMRPVVFESQKQVALIDNRYKIYSRDGGKSLELYDLLDDPGETSDISAQLPEVLSRMKETLEAWRDSCRRSRRGEDDDTRGER
jgi:hypothetical protein